MKLIKPSFEIIEQQFGESQEEILQNMYKHIERCGRTCYKSENKITEDSAKPFVDRMINSKHLAMLEHGTIYLTIDIPRKAFCKEIVDKYYRNKYTKCNNTYDEFNYHYYITTNLRVLIENGWEEDLQYLCKPTEFHKKRYTVKFISNIQFYKELTRHKLLICVA